MNTSLHDGGSRSDFAAQQKQSKDSPMSEMTVFTYLREYNPEFLRQAILTLANPSVRPTPEAELSEFSAVYRDLQTDVDFTGPVKSYTKADRDVLKSGRKLLNPVSFPRMECLAIRLGALGALDSTFDLLEVPQPTTEAIDAASVELTKSFVENFSAEGETSETEAFLLQTLQSAYDLYLEGYETAFNHVAESIEANYEFGNGEEDEELGGEEGEGDEEAILQEDESLSFAEPEELPSKHDLEDSITPESILEDIAVLLEVAENVGEELEPFNINGVEVDLTTVTAQMLAFSSKDMLVELKASIDSWHEETIEEDEDEGEFTEDFSTSDFEEVGLNLDLDTHLAERSQTSALGSLAHLSTTPKVKFSLSVIVEANPMEFGSSIDEVKKVLSECDYYTSEEPINFWNSLKSTSNAKGAQGFAYNAITSITEYLNEMANTPILVISDLGSDAVLNSIATSVQQAVSHLAYSFDEVDLHDIAIPIDPKADVLEALDNIDVDDITDATSEDYQDAGVNYVDINDLLYVSAYVTDSEEPTIAVRIHINLPPLAKTSVKTAITKVINSLSKMLANSNVETTLGFAYSSVHVFNDVDAGDSVRGLIEDGFELHTRSSIEDSALDLDSVLPESITPKEPDLISGMFPYQSDWLLIAELGAEETES